jgi:molybdopterin converting factor small subunit
VDADSAGQLRQRLAVLGPDASGVIAQCVLLRAGVRLEDHVALEGGETVDVLPPFAGG